MKHIFIIVALFFFSSKISAQSKVDESFKNDAKSLLEVLISDQFSNLGPVKEYYREPIDPIYYAEFDVKFEEKTAVLFEDLVVMFTNTYSHDEIKELLVFFNTPIGKKYISSLDGISIEMQNLMLKWSQSIESIAEQYPQHNQG